MVVVLILSGGVQLAFRVQLAFADHLQGGRCEHRRLIPTPVLSAPMASTTASATSTPNRDLFSTLPPQESVLWFETSCVNWSIKYPFALWISTPSKPVSAAFFAALFVLSDKFPNYFLRQWFRRSLARDKDIARAH
jgi:hypothetical protein